MNCNSVWGVCDHYILWARRVVVKGYTVDGAKILSLFSIKIKLLVLFRCNCKIYALPACSVGCRAWALGFILARR